MARRLPNPITDFMALSATKKLPQVVAELCEHCGNCTRCPYQAITLNGQKVPVFDPALCIGCSLCAQKCFAGAISMRPRTARELAALQHYRTCNHCNSLTLQPAMSLLIENGTVLTAGKTPAVLPNHSVLIENGYITRIAPKNRFKAFAGKRIDASRKVVAPGFINAHTHFYSTFARGLTKTKPAGNFVDVLKNLWWRLDSALTTRGLLLQRAGCPARSIRHGTTTLIDHHASPNAVRGSLPAIEKGRPPNRPARLPVL